MDRLKLRATVIGAAVGLLLLLATTLAPAALKERIREPLFDRLLAVSAPFRAVRDARPIVIIDIDSAALREVRPWPWRRDEIAKLAAAVLAAQPAALGIDIVLDGPDARSPAAAVRRLAREAGRPDLEALAHDLPDGDRALSLALDGKPVALSYVLDPQGRAEMPAAALFRRNRTALPRLWSAPGVSGPPPELADVASGHGVASLPGDADGVVRRIPLLAQAGERVVGGLAAETVRLAEGASGYMLASAPALSIGDAALRRAPGGMIRLLPTPPGTPIRIFPAADVMAGRIDGSLLKDAVVFIGASAPELGALRPSSADPLTPSVLLHAMAARQVAVGASPARPMRAGWWEGGLALAAMALAAWLAVALKPAAGVSLLFGGAAALVGGAAVLAAGDVLLNLAIPAATGVATYGGAAFAIFSLTRQREARLRRRFEQHLSPGVVARIVANPTALRLTGERRQVTALFTDVEGFTATAAACEPEEVIAALDGYFEGIAAIVIRHGGMIDKFVGDAAHVFFNMPLDLPGHVDKAIACAVEIAGWTETYRKDGLPARLGFGRTRIGLETGEAVVGDVGLSAKLDYTAHGDVVNAAARLEALNKDLGTTVCIGPAAAAATRRKLRPIGEIDVRGFGLMHLHTTDGA